MKTQTTQEEEYKYGYKILGWKSADEVKQEERTKAWMESILKRAKDEIEKEKTQ